MLSIKAARFLLSRHMVGRPNTSNSGMIDNTPLEMVLGTCSRLYGGIQNLLSRMYSSSPKRPFTVAIEGNIGSGKTSLLQHFNNSPDVEVLQEPVHMWRNIQGQNALAMMYEDPNRWALTFQTYVQLTMLETHIKPTEKPVKLMERSIYSAKYCFVENLKRSGKMPELEHIVLTRWFDWIVQNEDCNLDLIVYLQTTPETVFERIKKRGRKEEKPIPMDYLTTLHHLHEDWLIHQTNHTLPCPVLVLDANHDQQDMVKTYNDNRHKILGGKNL